MSTFAKFPGYPGFIPGNPPVVEQGSIPNIGVCTFLNGLEANMSGSHVVNVGEFLRQEVLRCQDIPICVFVILVIYIYR